MDKVLRVRFGVKLSWPITNAATFVMYISQSQFDKGSELMLGLKVWLSSVGRKDIAERLFIELA